MSNQSERDKEANCINARTAVSLELALLVDEAVSDSVEDGVLVAVQLPLGVIDALALELCTRS